MKTNSSNLRDRAKGTKPTTTVGKPKGKYPWLPLFIGAVALACLPMLTSLLFAAGAAKIALLIAFPEGQIRSGKSGTTVFNKNGTQRIWKYPKLVRNAFTTAVRSSLATLSGYWATLTQAQMNGWQSATGYTKVNRIGQTLQVTGKRLFVMLNQNLSLIGIAANFDYPGLKIANAPLITGTPAYSLATGIDFAFSNGAANFGVIYEATPMLSAGINRPSNNKFRIFSAVSDSSTPPASTTLAVAYAARFGTPILGSTIFVRAKFLANDTGGASPECEIIKLVVVA